MLRLGVLSKNIYSDRAMPNLMVAIAHLRKTHFDDGNAKLVRSTTITLDHRKVVSHIFGRNKACTRKLPENLWILWCRKHYQRFKYRAEDAENWHTIQLGLVRTSSPYLVAGQ